MTDVVQIPLDLALKRVATLYRCDDRGRMLSINQWDAGAPPRFYLMRTADNVICRFRADLPDVLVSRLQDLCDKEPKGDPLSKLPSRYEQYVDLLSSHASVSSIGAGPAYMSTQDVSRSALAVPITEDNAYLLRGGFEDWLPDVPHRQPFMAMVEDGRAVALCASVRISDAVHCAGVETRPEYRRRGHAMRAVAGWVCAVRSLGAIPFYSTPWDNIASQRVAAHLGMPLAGIDFHVT